MIRINKNNVLRFSVLLLLLCMISCSEPSPAIAMDDHKVSSGKTGVIYCGIVKQEVTCGYDHDLLYEQNEDLLTESEIKLCEADPVEPEVLSNNDEKNDINISIENKNKAGNKNNKTEKKKDNTKNKKKSDKKTKTGTDKETGLEIAYRDEIEACSKEKTILYRIVEAEAGGEDLSGRILVANVVINRMKSSEFPDTIQGVVFDHSGSTYQFSPVKDGRYYSVNVSKLTKEAVNTALGGFDNSSGAKYFLCRSLADPRGTSWFDRALKFLFRYGCHEFFS